METELIPALPSLDFSRAKGTLSDVMTRVVHEHRPSVVSRHRGKEQMLLVRTDDLARYLDAFGFDLEVVDDQGEVTVALPKLGMLGFGANRDEAIDDLLVELGHLNECVLQSHLHHQREQRDSEEGVAEEAELLRAEQSRQHDLAHEGCRDAPDGAEVVPAHAANRAA